MESYTPSWEVTKNMVKHGPDRYGVTVNSLEGLGWVVISEGVGQDETGAKLVSGKYWSLYVKHHVIFL